MPLTSLRRRIFRVPRPAALRRLPAGAPRAHVDAVDRFLDGYHAALADRAMHALARRLDEVEPALRGFAYEGAGMALALVDAFAPRSRRRFEEFCAGPAERHIYMAYVGRGWALARLPRGARRAMSELDPLLRWLAVDGYGFHQAFFGRARRDLGGYFTRAADQGRGRSLWFQAAADGERAIALVQAADPARRADLWSGLGLAVSYAGGAVRDPWDALLRAAGEHACSLAQGVAFAAAARVRAEHVPAHTSVACARVWSATAEQVGAMALELGARCAAREVEPRDEPRDGVPYEAWRSAIREFARSALAVEEVSGA